MIVKTLNMATCGSILTLLAFLNFSSGCEKKSEGPVLEAKVIAADHSDMVMKGFNTDFFINHFKYLENQSGNHYYALAIEQEQIAAYQGWTDYNDQIKANFEFYQGYGTEFANIGREFLNEVRAPDFLDSNTHYHLPDRIKHYIARDMDKIADVINTMIAAENEETQKSSRYSSEKFVFLVGFAEQLQPYFDEFGITDKLKDSILEIHDYAIRTKGQENYVGEMTNTALRIMTVGEKAKKAKSIATMMLY